MKKWLHLLLTFCLLFVIACGYEFDEKSSCESMLPNINRTNLSVELSDSPYKLTVNVQKYRRNRRLKVKLDGGEFNGFFLQARQYSSSRSRTTDDNPLVVGTFLDFPASMATLDCGQGPSFSVANTIYYYNATNTKKWVEIPWMGPQNDVGSIEFIATVISGSKYWNPVKSASLLFNEFPPSLKGCGTVQSCYLYTKIPVGEMSTEYTLVVNVVNDDAIFIIGGKVVGDTGYVGIAFTNSSLGFVDMGVCVKSDASTVKAAHYIKVPNKALKKANEELEDAEVDIDGDFVWCKFRRPLKTASSQAADLTYGMTQIFLWGQVEPGTLKPIYPKDSDLVEISEPWNHTLTMNVIHYIGGSNLAGISWTLISAALLATLLELYRM